MCRLLISFENKNTKEIILEFLKQSNQSKKNTPGMDNPRDNINHINGYGLAWVSRNKWKIHKNPEIYTKDETLPVILEKIPKKLVIGHIRKKKYGIPKIENTHPFVFENQIFLQNGSIQDFPKNLPILKKYIHPKYISEIKGETDTEYLFFLFLSIKDTMKCKKENAIVNTFTKLFDLFSTLNIEIGANIIYANENYVAVTRYTYYDQTKYTEKQYSQSLYWNIPKNDCLLISSEPLVDKYELIPENSIIILNINENNVYHYQI
jgi:predicted glutamine amidotransferase